MAEETTTTEEETTTSNRLDYSDAELDELEKEFGGVEPEEKEISLDEFDEEEPDEETEETEVESEKTEEAGEETEGKGDVGEPEGEEVKDPAVAEEEDGEPEGYELVVDGQSILVDTEDELAAWAQKGIHYEKKQQDLERRIENSEFTVNAILADPINAILELWTANNYGGDFEAARHQMRGLVENWLDPLWKEELAKPHERYQMKESRMRERQQKHQQQQETQLESSFTQEDIDFIQNMDVQVSEALRGVDLPAESIPLRQWMAQVMRDGVDDGKSPNPTAAAQFIKGEQQKREEALGTSRTRKDRQKSGKSSSKAAIEAAKGRRSKPQASGKPPRGGRRRAEQKFITSREWLNGINEKLGVDY